MNGKCTITKLPNGNWGIWDNDTEQYKDTGRKVLGTDMGYHDLVSFPDKPYPANSQTPTAKS